MSRPKKKGLDYFPHDVDSVNDEKIEAMRSLYGNNGYAFYFILLERIYRTEKGELDISTDIKKATIISKLSIKQESFEEMLKSAFEIDLFNGEHFQKTKHLTSNGIQKRFKEVEKMRERWRNKKANDVFPEENEEENPMENDMENAEETGESKEKKSKYIYEQFFEQLWKLIPNKKGKNKVSLKQKMILYDIGLDELTKCIERYKSSKEDWKAWQQGSTFLNGGYIDYLDENFVEEEEKKPMAGGISF